MKRTSRDSFAADLGQSNQITIMKATVNYSVSPDIMQKIIQFNFNSR